MAGQHLGREHLGKLGQDLDGIASGIRGEGGGILLAALPLSHRGIRGARHGAALRGYESHAVDCFASLYLGAVEN